MVIEALKKPLRPLVTTLGLRPMLERYGVISKASIFSSTTYVTEHKDRRIGIVGVGPQGTKMARSLHNMGCALVSVCDTNQRRLHGFKQEFPGIFCTDNMDAFVDKELEVCILATLADAHYPLVKNLASRGIGKFLCEKPVVNTMRDWWMLSEIVQKLNLQLKVNHSRLWLPDYQDLSTVIQLGDMGSVTNIELCFKSHGFGNIGTHSIASGLYLSGCRIIGVEEACFDKTKCTSRKQGYTDYNGWAIYRLDNGGTMKADNRHSAIQPHPRISVSLEKARVEILEKTQTYTIDNGRDARDEFLLKCPWDGKKSPDLYAKLLDHAIGDLLGSRLSPNLECALGSVQAIIGAQIAAKEKKPISFPLPEDTVTPYMFS